MKENANIHAIKKEVKLHLDSDRYEHTLGVMYTAASLAMCYGEDIEKAMTAGVLHDCAKGIPNSKKIKLCEKYQIEVTESEKKNPELLHAKLALIWQYTNIMSVMRRLRRQSHLIRPGGRE